MGFDNYSTIAEELPLIKN